MCGIKTSANKTLEWYENKTCRNEYYVNNTVKLFPKVECPCGKTVYKYYLKNILKQNIIHKLCNFLF